MKVLKYFKNLVLGLLIGAASAVFVFCVGVLLSFVVLVSSLVSSLQGKDINFKVMSEKLEEATAQLKTK